MPWIRDGDDVNQYPRCKDCQPVGLASLQNRHAMCLLQAAMPTVDENQTTTMWVLLDQIADLERRVGRLYERFAELFRLAPLVAAYWREMAAEERLHALIVAAAREVFPATEPALAGQWPQQLADLGALLLTLETRAQQGMSLEEAFTCAETVEASELNAVTALIIHHSGNGFSRLGPLVSHAGLDQHREKVLQARQTFCSAEKTRS